MALKTLGQVLSFTIDNNIMLPKRFAMLGLLLKCVYAFEFLL